MFDLRGRSKSILARTVYHSGLFTARLARVRKDRFLALMYHRVIPRNEGGRFLQPGMYVEPETLDLHLCFLKRHFEILPVSTMVLPDMSQRMVHLEKRACYLTFDDGWSDFYRYAFPLLVKHQVPAVVFLPTGFVGTTNSFWTDTFTSILETLVAQGRFDELRRYVKFLLPQEYTDSLATTPEQFLERVINTLKTVHTGRITQFLKTLGRHFNISQMAARRDFVSWEQVEEMRSSGLVTFGSHTVSHRLLTTLSEDEIGMELRVSKQQLLENGAVENGQVSFCYPNGNYNKSALRQLLAEDYSFAFTTSSGWNSPDTPVFELKRVGLHQDVSHSKELLAYRIYSALSVQ